MPRQISTSPRIRWILLMAGRIRCHRTGTPRLPSIVTLRAAIDQISAEWFVIAGSLPPGVETTIYRELAQSLKARQKKVALDTSGETLNHAIEALPTLIKPNIHELEALVKRPLPSREAVIEAARELVAQGIGTVVVSMGHQGACFVATPPEIEVRSTVGAGDAMVAGMVSAKLRGLSLPQAARLSTAFSVRAIGKLDPELTVEALSEKVAITS